MGRLALLCFAGLISDACSNGSDSDDGAARSGAVLILTQPSDITSNIGAAPVRVILEPWGGVVTSQMIQDVRANISAFSNLAEIEVDTELEIDNSADSGNPQTNASYPTTILARPRAGMWPDSWVQLVIAALPRGVIASRVRVIDGDVVARFSVISRPVFKGVQFCPKEDGVVRVLLSFSEPVVDETADEYWQVSKDGVSCRLLAQPVDSELLTFSCDPPAPGGSFLVVMNPGFRATTGAIVTDFKGHESVDIRERFEDMPETQTGCRGVLE